MKHRLTKSYGDVDRMSYHCEGRLFSNFSSFSKHKCVVALYNHETFTSDREGITRNIRALKLAFFNFNANRKSAVCTIK